MYQAFERIREAAPLHAEKWLNRLFEAIFSSRSTRKLGGYPARQLLFGRGNGVYRIIFHIRDEEQHVRVLRVWHASRDAISAADLEE